MTSLAMQLSESFRSAGVKSIYGDPVDLEGVTIIPVALAWYGFGGGDNGGSEGGAGALGGPMAGGGGGGASIPIGAYVKTSKGAWFQPNLVSLIAVSIPAMWVWGHAMSRVIKSLKK
ncbi:hypothetical protein KPL76_08850 [Subtercola sp. PAMC28395]|uniref:hypothetical protein n=1 Tax=Subtercola sp. PAMC28395 TaxID=2846775 RepID=UPI001C0AC9A0|nr:hypothetical protein [Subtercola sp. PAMC28395]QWT22901.1 hypothetical protein KPL76_08850 [Subtercola sp. PAMC28395]